MVSFNGVNNFFFYDKTFRLQVQSFNLASIFHLRIIVRCSNVNLSKVKEFALTFFDLYFKLTYILKGESHFQG